MQVLSAANAQEIVEYRARGEPVWLDLEGARRIADLPHLADALGVSAKVIEDLSEFGQRPRLARHEDHAVLVFYGARLGDHDEVEPLEVHLLLGPDGLVTACALSLPTVAELHEDGELDSRIAAERVLRVLSDSVVGVLEAVDNEIVDIEEAVVEEPSDPQVRRLTRLRRNIAVLSRATSLERDLVLREEDSLAALPGLSAAGVKDLHLRLVTARDLIDATRDLATGALSLYVSAVSTRLNLIGERLNLVATVALPLVVLTGFFGQNFGWLIGEIDSLLAFLLLGLGAPLALASGLVYFFRRRGYI